MQDDYPYGFDDKLVDRAWSNMQQMLDKEMPAEQEPERKAWIWWLAGTLLVLGLFLTGVYYYNTTPQPSTDASGNPVERPIAARPGHTELPKSVQEATSPTALPSTDQDARVAVDEEPSLQQTAGEHTQSISTQQVNTSLPPTPSKHTDIPLPKTSSQEKTSTALADEVIESEKLVVKKNEEVTNSRSAIPALPPLSASLNALPDLPVAEAVETSIEPLGQKRLLKFGIEGSIYSQGISKLHGIGAAAVVELHKGHNRTYFKSAIGYQLFQPDLVEREKSLEFNNTALMPSPAPAGDPPPPDIITTKSSITELRYAYLVLAAGYKLNDRFSLEAGIMPAWLLSSTLTETWTHTPALAEGGGAGSTPFVSRISDDPVEISKRQFNLIGGVSYQANPSLSLNLHYQHAIKNVLPQAQNESYLRGAKISLCYYIR